MSGLCDRAGEAWVVCSAGLGERAGDGDGSVGEAVEESAGGLGRVSTDLSAIPTVVLAGEVAEASCESAPSALGSREVSVISSQRRG